MTYTLRRERSTKDGTFGVLYRGEKPLCVTCEDPWLDNRPGESCIQPGTYECGAFSGTRFKNVWEVKNVSGRSAILIHNGNTKLDTHGCILVGRSLGQANGLPAVIDSVATLNMLRKVLPSEFTLTVVAAE